MSNFDPAEIPEMIAIIGMAGRFPGAPDIDALWRNLRDGVESIARLTDAELLEAGVSAGQISDPAYVKSKGVLADVDLFDAQFFGLNPSEAQLTDPQHRLFLECAWEALEDAGYDSESYAGPIGVYAGSSMNTYLSRAIDAQPGQMDSVSSYQIFVGNDKDFLPTRVSYKLNLRGPSVTIQTACSTSLVAVHQACQSLLSYQCDMALAGGVSIFFPQRAGYLYQEGMIFSPDGHCRAFDAEARGTVSGEGVGIVLLKRLAEARADGDHIYAVIRGSAINNDGAVKVGFTAPSVEGQAEVIAMAHAVAEVDPESLGYIEAHGTGTPLGDPVEIAALSKVFRAGTSRSGFCAIGSVKTNLGHLDAAAGVAGLIKTSLALSHGLLPPSLHYKEPNPAIDFAGSPFYVNAALRPWEANGSPRRAGVSSFGIGGTNAHVVLEEAPPRTPAPSARQWHLVALSARSAGALEAATANLGRHLRDYPELSLADVAYTLQVGRRAFEQRRIVVCGDAADAAGALEALPPARVYTQAPAGRPDVVFMFTGQGAQYVDMGRGLYEDEAPFRAAVDRCAELLRPRLGLDLRDLLFPGPQAAEEAAARLGETALTQPALFVIEYALAQLWAAWGVRPAAMIGHSVGEYVAACLAGVFSLEDALALVAARGRLMQALPRGAMLAVALSEQELLPLIEGQALSLAASNAPRLSVISGPVEAVTALQARLGQQGVEHQLLRTSHAFHSAMMEPACAPFIGELRGLTLRAPQIPFISNVTGSWITAAEATDPAYWAAHLRRQVRFAEGLEALLTTGPSQILLEVGPGQTLAQLARQHPARQPGHAVLTSLRHPREQHPDVAFALTAMGRLWLHGADVDWRALYEDEQRQRVRLPTYPFERRRYWAGPRRERARPGPAQPQADKRDDLAAWFYLPGWTRKQLAGQTAPPAEGPQTWLIFDDRSQLGEALVKRLAAAGHEVVTVAPARAFKQVAERAYTLRVRQPQDYRALLGRLGAEGRLPDRLVHLWSVTAARGALGPRRRWDRRAQAHGFYSLLYLVQALDGEAAGRPLDLHIVTADLHEVRGDEHLSPAAATLLGLCRVIPQEHPNLRCRMADFTMASLGRAEAPQAAEQLVEELRAEAGDPVVAYRGPHRWVEAVQPARLGPLAQEAPSLRQRGIYLITGGLGGVGYRLAEHLARGVEARLALLARSDVPPRPEWPRWLQAHSPDDEVSRRIRKVLALEELGAEVLVIRANVADARQMRAALARVDRYFGGLDGVIYTAGTVKMTQLADLDRERCEEQFLTKGRGLAVLEGALKGRLLDFCLLTSSLSAVLGGLGYGAYAAANAYMDAFVRRHNSRGKQPWTCVNWDAWAAPGQGAGAGKAPAGVADLAMTADEGVETFRRVIALAPGRQVIVSTGELQARIDRWVGPAAAEQWAAPEAPAEHPRASDAAYVAPRTGAEERLAAIWREQLGVGQVGVHDTFFDLGGSSLIAVRMFAQIEREFGKKLALATLFDAQTIAQIAELLGDEPTQRESAWSSLVPIQPGGTRPPLFCVHAAGGNVLLFRDLARHLGPDQPVYGLQAQGLDGQLPVLTSIEAMAERYVAEILRMRPEGPYLLGGYCMGGTVAIEMAQRLRAQGHQVPVLAVFETYNWHRMPLNTLADAAHFYLQKIEFHIRNFMLLNTAGKRTFFNEKLKVAQSRRQVWRGALQARLGWLDASKGARQLLPAKLWEVNDQAALDYRPRPYPGRITHFRPIKEYACHSGPELGWETFAEGVEQHRMPSYPAGMLVEPFVAQLAARLRDCIDRALAEEGVRGSPQEQPALVLERG
ncbi:MAG: SDR family oxidoreductase [Chloroflexales bacterium]|nr:SDR family oxidoreductase [Chloroflexales bacterium]